MPIAITPAVALPSVQLAPVAATRGKFMIEAPLAPLAPASFQRTEVSGWRKLSNTQPKAIAAAVKAQQAYVNALGQEHSVQSHSLLKAALSATLDLVDHPKTTRADQDRLMMWCREAVTPHVGSLVNDKDFLIIANRASHIFFKRATGLERVVEPQVAYVDVGICDVNGYPNVKAVVSNVEVWRETHPRGFTWDLLLAEHWHAFDRSNDRLTSTESNYLDRTTMGTAGEFLDSITATERTAIFSGVLPWNVPDCLREAGQNLMDLTSTVQSELRTGGLQNFYPPEPFQPQLPVDGASGASDGAKANPFGLVASYLEN
ncbi:MAG: hypothetical protein H7255_17380 [Ramlibacter sp.]|nr:hypothetical protein [Ramlibacter sp.]